MQIENFTNQVKVDLEPLKKYESLVITTNSDATYVAERIGEIKKQIKAIEAQRLSYTKPLDEAKAKLIEDERKITAPLNDILKTLNTKMVVWTQSQEAIRRAEAEKKRKEELAALEAERQRQIALAATTDSEEAIKAVEEIQKNAERLEAAPIKVSNTVKTDAGGWTIRSNWKYRIVDQNLIPRQYMVPDEKSIGYVARTDKEKANIPGVVFFEEKGGIVR